MLSQPSFYNLLVASSIKGGKDKKLDLMSGELSLH